MHWLSVSSRTLWFINIKVLMRRLGINVEVDYISFCGSVKLRLIVVYKTDRVVECLRTSSSL